MVDEASFLRLTAVELPTAEYLMTEMMKITVKIENSSNTQIIELTTQIVQTI